VDEFKNSTTKACEACAPGYSTNNLSEQDACQCKSKLRVTQHTKSAVNTSLRCRATMAPCVEHCDTVHNHMCAVCRPASLRCLTSGQWHCVAYTTVLQITDQSSGQTYRCTWRQRGLWAHGVQPGCTQLHSVGSSESGMACHVCFIGRLPHPAPPPKHLLTYSLTRWCWHPQFAGIVTR
jgi:hypothetical protein